MASGHPQNQAVAAAMRQAGRPKPGVKGKPKKVAVPKKKTPPPSAPSADEPGMGY